MEFSKQGKRLSKNAQLLLMSMRDPDRPKLDSAEFDKIALSKPDKYFPLLQKRGRGRPRKYPIEQNKSNDPPLLQKRGRGRPRKYPIEQNKSYSPLLQKRGRGRPRKVEPEIQVKLKENNILDIKEKLKLLETITNGYKEIERIDKETQKNLKKLCIMTHNKKL